MRIKRNEDGLVLSLNRDFYSKEVVGLAARDFGKVCRISSSDRGGYHVIRFSGLEMEDLEEVVLEFANYILSLMKQSDRGEK